MAMYRSKRRGGYGDPADSYTKNRDELRIFWAPEFCMYAARCPDGGEKLRQNMHLIDLSKWDPSNKLWLVPENALEDLIAVLIDSFSPRIPTVDKKPDATAHQVMADLNEGTAAIIDMFRAAGYDESKKMYSMLVKQFERAWKDVDCPQDIKDKAALVTRGWREVKRGCGWS